MQEIIKLLKETIAYYYDEAHLRIGLKIEGIRRAVTDNENLFLEPQV